MSVYDVNTEIWDPTLVFLCLQGLPKITQTLWEQSVKDKSSLSSWKDLDAFFTERICTLMCLHDMRATGQSKRSHNSKVQAHHSNSRIPEPPRSPRASKSSNCLICQNQRHNLYDCPRFKSFTPADRYKVMKRHYICINCLRNNHEVKNCDSKRRCSKCNKSRHTLLHRGDITSSNSTRTSTVTSNAPQNSSATPSTVSTNSENCAPCTSAGDLPRQRDSFEAPCAFYECCNFRVSCSLSATANKACRLQISSLFDPSLKLETNVLVLRASSGNLPSFVVNSDLRFDYSSCLEANSSAALAEPMQTESESISTDSSAAPVLDSPPQNDTLQTESESSGPSAAPVVTPHLEESEKNLRSETHKISSAVSHKCRLFDRMHPLDRCSDFRVMNVDMRHRIILKYNDRIRCLSKSHQARDCRSKRKCAVCNEEHHTLLQEDTKTVVKPTNNRQRRPRTEYRYRSPATYAAIDGVELNANGTGGGEQEEKPRNANTKRSTISQMTTAATDAIKNEERNNNSLIYDNINENLNNKLLQNVVVVKDIQQQRQQRRNEQSTPQEERQQNPKNLLSPTEKLDDIAMVKDQLKENNNNVHGEPKITVDCQDNINDMECYSNVENVMNENENKNGINQNTKANESKTQFQAKLIRQFALTHKKMSRINLFTCQVTGNHNRDGSPKESYRNLMERKKETAQLLDQLFTGGKSLDKLESDNRGLILKIIQIDHLIPKKRTDSGPANQRGRFERTNTRNVGGPNSRNSLSNTNWLDQILRPEYYSQLVVVDLACGEASRKLLEMASNKALFNSLYHWLLMEDYTFNGQTGINDADDDMKNKKNSDSKTETGTATGTRENIENFLEKLNININTELILAKRRMDYYYLLYDVWSPGRQYGGKLNTSEIGEFSASQGLELVDWYKGSSFIMRRLNMHLARIRCLVVVTHKNGSNSLHEYLISHIDTHLDSMNRFNFALLSHVRDLFNFSFVLSKTATWGYLKNGKFDGMIGALVRKQADIGGSPIFFRIERAKVIDYTTRTWVARPCFIFRHPRSTKKDRIVFLQPFSNDVWILLAGCGVATILLLWLLTTLETDGRPVSAVIPTKSFPHGSFKKRLVRWGGLLCGYDIRDDNSATQRVGMFLESILFYVGSICQQGLTFSTRSFSGRCIVTTSLLFSFAIYQFYSASIVGTLLMEKPKTIRTLRDLIHSSLEIGIEDIVYNRDYFLRTKDPDAQELYAKKVTSMPTADGTGFVDAPPDNVVLPTSIIPMTEAQKAKAYRDILHSHETGAHAKTNEASNWYEPEYGVAKIKKGHFAFHVDVATAYKIMADTFTEKEICDLTEIQLFPPQKMVSIVQKGSPLRKPITYGLRRVTEVGLMDYEHKIWHSPRPRCVKQLHTDDLRVDMQTFTSALLVLMFGILVSGLILSLEIMHHR
uniref:Ionotropic glutamate receptor C-terminal domain-containing protein n=1 Tax=Musca domestica TaxID=7370 RepID=A0A1I8M9U0_MUSDO